MNIVKLISDKALEIAENGQLEEIVNKHVLKCIDDIVKDTFTWSGEGKKALEAAIKESLALPLENINVSQYQKIISNIVEEQINNTAVENAKHEIKSIVDSITGVLDKKEIKLSEIIAKYVEGLDKSFDGDMDDQYGELSFHVDESSASFNHIYFDKDSDKEKYECKNRIGLHNGKIFTAEFEGTPFSPFSINIGRGFEAFLFQLYANNIVVILDIQKVECEYYREDCN